MDFIVLKLKTERYVSYGPVRASSPGAAIETVAEGTGVYVAQGRGHYVAIPLHVWQAGVADYTKTSGLVPMVGASG